MVDRITARIEEAFDANGLEAAQAKYSAYFIGTALYLKYKPEVDATLVIDGHADYIVVPVVKA